MRKVASQPRQRVGPPRGTLEPAGCVSRWVEGGCALDGAEVGPEFMREHHQRRSTLEAAEVESDAYQYHQRSRIWFRCTPEIGTAHVPWIPSGRISDSDSNERRMCF